MNLFSKPFAVGMLCGLAALAAMPPCAVADLPPPPAVEKQVDAGDFAALQAELSRWLLNAEAECSATTPAAKFTALLRERTYRQALAQHELIQVTGAANLAALAGERNGRAFLKTFLWDPEWIEMWLASGPLPANSAEGLGYLRDIWVADRSPARTKYHALASAVALAFSAEPTCGRMRGMMYSPFRPVTPVSRYFFYRNAHATRRLHPMFDGLKTWELRFVVSGNQSQDDASLVWLLDNVNLPLWKYTDACWMVEYRGASAYGDTVQGPLFNMPWSRRMNWAENAFRHGGVCGTLSTFGCLSAQAHGIPAYTCGQPGHCAYAVRFERRKWVGGFGGPAGGPHNYFWSGSYYYILLMEDAFFDDAALLRSEQHLWQANLHRDADRPAAYAAYELALLQCRANYHAWDELIALQLADPAVTAAQWRKTAEQLLARLGKHTRPMTDLLAKFEDAKLLAGASDADKVKWFTAVHRTIAATTGEITWDWNMEDFFQKQVRALKDPAAQWDLYRNAIGIHAGREQFLGQLLTWGTKASEKSGDPKQYIAAATAALRERGGAMKEEMLRKTLCSLILAAEKAKSIDAFQAVGDTAKKFSQPSDGDLKLERPAGLRLVSGDGMLWLSTTSGWDQPCSHRDVLRETGGKFHTDQENAPYAVVQLKSAATLTGILIVNTASFQERAVPLKVYTSSDGATWIPVWETSEVKRQWYIPLAGKHIQARWVKVESAHGPDKGFLHLRNICVYGEGR
jgi:hypothetical protein